MASDEVKAKPSIQSNTLAETVANEELTKTDNFDTLKKLYLNLMHQLEIDGIPKEKISAVGQKIVVDKKRSIMKAKGASVKELKNINIGTWWYDVAREQNYTDQSFNRGLATDAELKIVLPTKYEKENSEYIKIIKDTKEFFDVVLDKLKNNHFMSLLNEEDDKVSLALHDWKAQLKIAESFFDHKEKIPVNTQHILYHCIGTISSNNDVALKYFELRDKAHKLTGKQISKYRSGIIKNGLKIFTPTDHVSAVLWDYFGVQCQCNSWRVELLSIKKEKSVVKCFDCKNIFDTKSVIRCNYCDFPFFENEIKYIKEKKNTCPNCHEELPEYLINYILN